MRRLPSSSERPRRTALPWSAATGIALLLAGCGDGAHDATTTAPDAGPAGREGPRRVLLFTVDTLRADALGIYGRASSPSPRLDAFAQQAVVFEHAYSQATLTNPALTSMLTGLFPSQHGVHEQSAGFARGVLPVQVILQAEGVATGAFIANMCKLQDKRLTVYHDGWDERFCGMFDQPPDEREQYRWDEAVVDAGLNWIEGRDGDWFAWIHLMDPHAEHRPPPHIWDWDVSPPREKTDEYHYYGAFEERREIPPADVLANLNALYTAEVRGADEQFGRVLDFLDARDLGESTTVMFAADHGEELFETWFRYDHGFSMTEGVFHVPLVVRAPASAARRVAEPVELLQVTPTLLELFGLTLPYELPARSLLDAQPSRGCAFSFGGSVTTSVRTPTHRYWRRHTATPFTRDVAAWRTEAPWFQERDSLATYEAAQGWAPTWLDVDSEEGRARARELLTLINRHVEAQRSFGEGVEIDDPEHQARLQALGYLSYTQPDDDERDEK